MIGRKEAIRSLEWDMEKEEPQFVAVYGRRRVGKTYLIRTFFKDQFAFYHTGIRKGNRVDIESLHGRIPLRQDAGKGH